MAHKASALEDLRSWLRGRIENLREAIRDRQRWLGRAGLSEEQRERLTLSLAECQRSLERFGRWLEALEEPAVRNAA